MYSKMVALLPRIHPRKLLMVFRVGLMDLREEESFHIIHFRMRWESSVTLNHCVDGRLLQVRGCTISQTVLIELRIVKLALYHIFQFTHVDRFHCSRSTDDDNAQSQDDTPIHQRSISSQLCPHSIPHGANGSNIHSRKPHNRRKSLLILLRKSSHDTPREHPPRSHHQCHPVSLNSAIKHVKNARAT